MFQPAGSSSVSFILHALREDADGSGGDQHFRFGVNVGQISETFKQTPEALRRKFIFCTPHHLKTLKTRTQGCFSDSDGIYFLLLVILIGSGFESLFFCGRFKMVKTGETGENEEQTQRTLILSHSFYL